jgi:hypothetical protein
VSAMLISPTNKIEFLSIVEKKISQNCFKKQGRENSNAKIVE